MQNLKYYVLGVKNSECLKEYLDKFYNKLINDLKGIQKLYLKKEISNLIKSDNKKFIINADISSLIQSITLDNNLESVNKLKNEIKYFLQNGMNSKNLLLNKGKNIAGTNIKLSSEDNNPYNGRDAHPEHREQGAISGSWGDKSHNEWLEVYEKSFTLLRQIDEGIYDELNQIITKIIPLGTSKGVHNSASYKECIGHLYMGYTIDSSKPEINILEGIIHESSHNKLNLIMQFDPIVLNDKSEKYYSAIRPDARHIYGVFLGYHAFAPTMYIIMKAYKSGFLGNDQMWLEKIVLYYIKTKLLQKVIKKYAILTDLGREISEEIDYVIFKMDSLFKKINPSKELILIVKKRQIEHFNDVNRKYRNLKY